MKPYSPSPVLAVGIIATQLLGPAALWAAEQRGIRVEASRQIIVSALSGNQLTADTKALQFREAVAEDATLTTGTGTTAELLIGIRAVVTMGNGTTAQVRTVSGDQTTIQVTTGTVRVAAAASAIGSQGLVTVQTPTSQVQTHGGIVWVQVEPVGAKAERVPMGDAYVYRVSSVSERMAAVANSSSELIQVDEGTAEIFGSGGKSVTIQAGQRVVLESGKAGIIGEGVKPEIMRPGVVATVGHNQTSKEGRDHLVALQVDQATQLSKAITGAAETTGKGESDKKSDMKNVINGATRGVTLASTNLVSALFGNGDVASVTAGTPTNTTGAGYGGHNNNGFTGFVGVDTQQIKTNGNASALLVFTRMDPVGVVTEDVFDASNNVIGSKAIPQKDGSGNVVLKPSILGSFSGTRELVLVGGTSNDGHGGTAPTEALIVRGATPTNVAIVPSDFVSGGGTETDPAVVNANSTFVVKTPSITNGSTALDHTITGGTLSMFSSRADGLVLDDTDQKGMSFVDGAVTAFGSKVVLKGGVILDQKTTVTVDETIATGKYFDLSLNPLVDPKNQKLRVEDARFNGSLLSVIDGPKGRTSLIMQDRMLGVYDGSQIKTEGGNKALLSVLDAKLKGPGSSIPLIDIAAGTHFDRDGKLTPGSQPQVTVTSALVTRSTIPLDAALLEASAPLLALTTATMTTTNHFADLAGTQAQSLRLGDALVALNASKLIINNGHLLNLNNATAAISGYLFSLTNGSTFQLNNGSLFNLNHNSSLTLTSNAFGVFGDGASRLTINNNLCSTGPCGDLVNSAGQDILLNGAPIRVAGMTQDVVLPNNFNVFAGNNAATVTLGKDAALFQVDSTSTLMINGTKVK